MPSAKIENKAPSETPQTENSTPIRQVLVLIEHKIRNLEKRKAKLETYKEIQNGGKELTVDQLTAVAKYDEVTQVLEFCRDIVKNIQIITAVNEKEQKKQARRDLLKRSQQDAAKIREVLLIQNTLEQLCQDEVRNDFVNGTNGAVKLTQEEFDLIDKYYEDVTPKRLEDSNNEVFSAAAQKSAEHILSAIECRPKPYEGEVTYEKVREIIDQVYTSEYFDKKPEPIEQTNGTESTEIESKEIEAEPSESDAVEERGESVDSSIENQLESIQPEVLKTVTTAQVYAPPIVIANPGQIVASPQSQIPLQPIVPAAVVPAGVAVPPGTNPTVLATNNQLQQHMGPTTVRAVEQNYFKHQYLQQMRPIAEVVNSGNFYFLQDSELDSPDPFPNLGVNFQPNIQQIPPQIVGAIPNNNAPPQGTGGVGIVNQQVPIPVSQQQPQQQQHQHQTQLIDQKSGIQNQQVVSGIATQTYTNQNYKPMVQQQGGGVSSGGASVYPPLKQNDLSSQHITQGFTGQNGQPLGGMGGTGQILPPGSVQTVPPQTVPVQQIIAPSPQAVPIPGFPSPQQYIQQKSTVSIQSNSSSPHSNEINKKQQQHLNQSPPNYTTEPKIETWDASEVNNHSKDHHSKNDHQNSNDGEMKEWSMQKNDANNQKQPEITTWNESNPDGSYMGNNRGYQRGPRTGGGPSSSSRGNNQSSRSSGGSGSGMDRSTNNSMNYRGRPNNSFQSNNNSGRSSGGTGGSGGNNGSYFRNNDNNYYQQQMSNGGGGGGNANYSNMNSRQESGGYNSVYKSSRGGAGGAGTGNNGNSMGGSGGGGGGNMRMGGGGGGSSNMRATANGNNGSSERSRMPPPNNSLPPNRNGGGGNGGGNMRPSAQRGSVPPSGYNTGAPRSTNQSRPSQNVNV